MKRRTYGPMSSSRMLSPENDAQAVAVGKVLTEPQRVGDAAFALLVGVIDILQPELAPVTEQSQEVAGRVATGDDHDVANPGAAQCLERIVDHRLVVDRQKVLVRHLS